MKLQEVRFSRPFAWLMIGLVSAASTTLLWVMFMLTDHFTENYSSFQVELVSQVIHGFLAVEAALVMWGLIGFAMNQRSSKK